MEGYLTHWNVITFCFYCSSEPSLLLFCVDFCMAYPPLITKKLLKGENNEFWPSIDRYGNAI